MSVEEIFQEDIPLAPYTSIGLGGRARYFATCGSVGDLRDCLTWVAAKNLPVQILGGGSNIIFSDSGFSGLVIKIALEGVDFSEDGEQVQVIASAGQDWDAFVRICVERGLAGLECLSGIPGQVGATPIQNVGAYGQEVQETITQVRALDRRTLEIVEFTGAECRFAYRQSRFKAEDRDRYVVVEVTYHLRPDGRPELRYPELRRRLEEQLDLDSLESGAPVLSAVREAVLQLRRGKSMVADPEDPNAHSVGSFFLNPVLTKDQFAVFAERIGDRSSIPTFDASGGIKVPAAWLVERAGFHKGHRRKGAGISAHHALALINCGGTTCELLELAAEIQQEVFKKFGIKLDREPIIVE